MYMLIIGFLAFAIGMKIGWDAATEWSAYRVKTAIKLADDIGATEITEVLKEEK